MMRESDHDRSGLWSALLAALFFGISTPLAKALLVEIPPEILAGLFYLGSGIGLTFLNFVFRTKPIVHEAPLTRADAPWLSGAVIFGGILAPILLLTGLQQTAAVNTSLLLNLEGVFTVILAWGIFHENANRKLVLGVGAILSGSVLLAWRGIGSATDLAGPAAIAIACFCWGIDNNLTQRISAGDPVQISAIKGLVAGTVNLSLGLWLLKPWPSFVWAADALVIGFLSYGLSIMFFVRALRSLGTARTGAYFSAAPFIGAIMSVVILQETVTLSLIAASVAMIVGVWFLLSEKHAHIHIHQSLVHSHRHIHDEHHQHKHGPHDTSSEPHVHLHEHAQLTHSHSHTPDIHHRHLHKKHEPTRDKQ